MPITESEVERIAGLARVKLTKKEREKMAEDLGSILGYIERLKKIDTSNVEPMAQVTGLENILRKDEPRGDDARLKIIDQFPRKKEDYLKVKAVFSAEGGPASGGEES